MSGVLMDCSAGGSTTPDAEANWMPAGLQFAGLLLESDNKYAKEAGYRITVPTTRTAVVLVISSQCTGGHGYPHHQ